MSDCPPGHCEPRPTREQIRAAEEVLEKIRYGRMLMDLLRPVIPTGLRWIE